jgi:hypothetical protein
MVSLIKLIEKGKIPSNQFMDLETLNWLKKNKPVFKLENSFKFECKSSLDYISEIERYIPKLEWFLVSKKTDTIHGMRHILRTIFHSILLVSLSKNPSQRLCMKSLVASSLHDLRRRTDLMDLNHGKRAARWFKNNIKLIEDQFQIHFSQEDIDEIHSAIFYHNVPYEKIDENRDLEKNRLLIDILKTADALDRYRLPSLRLWFKDKYVSIVPSNDLKFTAYNLVIKSEAKFLDGLSNVNSVLRAIEEVCE